MTQIVVFILLFFVVIQNDCAQWRIPRETSPPPPPKVWLISYSETDTVGRTVADEQFKTQSEFQNDFIIKNGSNYVVLADTTTVMFTCQADYPITWYFPNVNHMESLSPYAFEMYTERRAEFQQDQDQPTNKYFEATLFIDFLFSDFFSATLECKAVPARESKETKKTNDTGTPSASVHVFYEGKKIMERMDEIVQIYVPPTKQEDKSGRDKVIFPCRPATPKISVLMEKQVAIKNKGGSTTKKWIKFKVPSKFVTFDPKVGFVLLKDTINGQRSYIFGLYRCTAVEDAHTRREDKRAKNEPIDPSNVSNGQEAERCCVYVNVTSVKPKGLSYGQLNNALHLSGNGSVVYNNLTFGNHPPNVSSSSNSSQGITEIWCCSGVAKSPPSIRHDVCRDPVQCQVMHQLMIQRLREGNGLSSHSPSHGPQVRPDCTRDILKTDGLVTCVGDNVQFSPRFVYLFDDGGMLGTNGSNKKSQDGQLESLMKLETETNATMAPISQKTLLVVGYSLTSDELLRNRRYYHVHAGVSLQEIIHFHGGDFDSQDTDETNYAEFQHFGMDYREARADKIAEYPRHVYYEREPLVFVCLGWRYLYSAGIWLSISWRNGSRTVLVSAPLSKSGVRTVYLSKETGTLDLADATVVHKISAAVPASKDMVSVECWLPQWNTHKWDKVTRNLTVLEARAPQFAKGVGNTTEEMVYYNLNDDNGGHLKELVCQVVKATPEPRLNVTKDGIGILGRFQGVNHSVQEYIPSKMSHVINVTILSVAATSHKNNNSNGDTTTGSDVKMVTVKIIFPRVTEGIQGVYQCTAENVRGKVSRTFKVVVKKKKTTLLSVLVATSLLLVLVVVMGVTHWQRPRNRQAPRERRSRQL